MFSIRNYNQDDFSMLLKWWILQNEFPPTKEMLPEESTFICEYENIPLVSITLYLTNSKEFCLLDNFVGNPEWKGILRKSASREIIKHAEKVAKELGYKSIMCMAYKPNLKEYYPSFGYTQRLDNVSTFNKELN